MAELQFQETENLVALEFESGLRPPPDFTIDEWADRYRQVPQVSSPEPGLWRTSRVPYLREIHYELSPKSHAQEVIFMKGSQIGATETAINFLLFGIDHDPSPMLMVQPTIDVAKKYSKQRLGPSIDACPPLSGKILKNKSRDTSNTMLQKDFPGGTLIIGGANSAASLRSMPMRKLVLDEMDGYPQDVDGEGDPAKLAERRTANFSRKKIFKISTPTIRTVSRIESEFDKSDQRYYYVPCRHCGMKQIIKWERIKFKNRDPKTVYLECGSCNEAIHEHHKTFMLEHGEWRKHNKKSEIPGFHLSALYSPLGWYSWQDAVKDHIEAIGNPQKRKVWVNTVLGECWDESSTQIDSHFLEKRKEKYNAPVPHGVVLLTAGVDTQDDRLECTIDGWGPNNESWKIAHEVFLGSPGSDVVWKLLDAFLLKRWEHENGGELIAACTVIDAMGHFTDEVYKFCKEREYRYVFPGQGRGGSGRPIIARNQRRNQHGVYLFQIGVDQGKETLYNWFQNTEPGPGYVHFPSHFNTKYFEQVTSEKRLLRRSAGRPKLEWVLPNNRRNEALDCSIYSFAALRILNPAIEVFASRNLIYNVDYTNKPKPKGRRILSRGVQ